MRVERGYLHYGFPASVENRVTLMA